MRRLGRIHCVYPNVYRTLQLSVTLHETSGEFELSAWFSRTSECPHQLTNDSINEPLVSLVPMLIDTVNIHRYISIVADSVCDSFARSRPLAYFGQLSFRLHCPKNSHHVLINIVRVRGIRVSERAGIGCMRASKSVVVTPLYSPRLRLPCEQW